MSYTQEAIGRVVVIGETGSSATNTYLAGVVVNPSCYVYVTEVCELARSALEDIVVVAAEGSATVTAARTPLFAYLCT